MPSAGLQIFGAGLRLQQVTPGVADAGNAHVTGVMLADAGMLPSIVPPNWGPGFYSSRNIYLGTALNMTWGPQSDDVQSCMFLGSSTTARGNPNGTNIAYGVNVGSGQTLMEVGGTVIGGLAGNGTTAADPNASNFNVVVGYSAAAFSNYASVNGDTVIGANAKTGSGQNGVNPSFSSTIVGFQCRSSGAGKNIIIGAKTTTAFQNSILLVQNHGGNYAGTQDNQIKIGDPTQTKVEIGPFDLSNPVAGLFIQTANVAVANTVVETSIVGAGRGSMTIPADRLMAGTNIRIRARGVIADTATPTLQLRIKIGATTYCDTGAIPLTALAGTHGWVIDADLTVRTAGAGGTAIGAAIMNINSGTLIDMDTTNTVTTALNTTTAQTVDVTIQWGTAAPANTLTCTNLTMELIG